VSWHIRTCGITLLLLAVACGGGAETQPPPPAAASDGPSVLLISIDTLRADRLGCYGYRERPSSPNIDALADEGVLFENFITSSPWTTPAHLSMLTSLQPVTHGLTSSFAELWKGLHVTRDFYKLPDERVTLAEILRDNGFATAAFTAGGPLDPKIGFGQGFDFYDSSMFKLRDGNVGRMFDWIENNAGRRFFLFWHHFEVHAPYLGTDFIGDVLPEPTAELVSEKMRRISEVPMESIWPKGASRLRKMQQQVLHDHDAFNRDVCEAMYVSSILSADRWLGRLVAFLREQNLYDNTLLILTSDHGEEFADRNPSNYYNMHGHILYEEMVRVPLVMKLPEGKAAGTRVEPIARMIDLMPTILGLLGIAPEIDEMQGTQLSTGQIALGPPPESVAFMEVLARKHEQKGLRTGRYKYIVTIDEQMVASQGREYLPEQPPSPELYDLANDPGERSNLLAAAHPAELDELAAGFYRQLQRYISENKGLAEPVTLDEETIEKLKGLGYIGN
jgi:arylsulfatase A-like enzyme